MICSWQLVHRSKCRYLAFTMRDENMCRFRSYFQKNREQKNRQVSETIE